MKFIPHCCARFQVYTFVVQLLNFIFVISIFQLNMKFPGYANHSYYCKYLNSIVCCCRIIQTNTKCCVLCSYAHLIIFFKPVNCCYNIICRIFEMVVAWSGRRTAVQTVFKLLLATVIHFWNNLLHLIQYSDNIKSLFKHDTLWLLLLLLASFCVISGNIRRFIV